MPPKTISELRISCRADEDVFPVAHMLLMIVAMHGLKRQNLFLDKMGVRSATLITFDQFFLKVMNADLVKKPVLMFEVILRHNQEDHVTDGEVVLVSAVERE